jgi:hypothetical protein
MWSNHAGVHARLAELDAPPVDALGLPQMLQQRAVAATDVQHAAGGLHHIGDQLKIDADRGDAAVHYRRSLV